ncbi:MAG: hypothetical protein NC394_02680 [Bacteroides sp.]|nr:hypothetical protein [Bacteroides sp.]
MVKRTKYKRCQFVLEWVTLGLAAAWLTAALVLLNYFCDRENEILKRNLLMLSIIFDVLAYFGFSAMSVLPANNSLINTKKYGNGTKEYQYKRESGLRNFALAAKIAAAVIAVFMGLYKYIF